MKSKTRKNLINLVFWSHLPVVILWFGLFLIPTSIWAGRITFHFWFIVVIFGMQIIEGALYFPITKKMSLICPQTTLMQWLRGYPLKSKKNYDHSFISEYLKKFNLRFSHKAVNMINILAVIIISIQYFLFN